MAATMPAWMMENQPQAQFTSPAAGPPSPPPHVSVATRGFTPPLSTPAFHPTAYEPTPQAMGYGGRPAAPVSNPGYGGPMSSMSWLGGGGAPGGGSGTSLEDPNGDASGSVGGAGGGPAQYRFGFPEDDRPLLEELGIYPSHIKAKALAVLHPLKPMTSDVVEDTDLAGPLCFALMLGMFLTLQGKLSFGAIYGVSILGMVLGKALLGLMADSSVSLQFVLSVLGYCLLPNVLLAAAQTLKFWLFGTGGVMVPISIAFIVWSGYCATQMFVHALGMHHQRYLIMYPVVLFYATFAALTIF